MEHHNRLPRPPDPLFPESSTLQLSELGGVSYAVPHLPGTLRPFSATLGTPAPAESKKHDTAGTRDHTKQTTQRSDDGKVVADSIADTHVDT